MTLAIQKTTSSLSRLEDIKLVIRSLLISFGSRDITLNKLNSIYKQEEGEDIPYKDFNFTSLKDFLFTMPDVLSLEWNDKLQTQCAYHVDTEKSQHISSLVAREKKRPSTGKNKAKAHVLKEEYNLIDPHLLFEVLKDLWSTKSNRVRKEVILAEIQKRIGPYSFYGMKGLNSQLSEFLHLLNYDSDSIYFKDKISASNTNSQKNESKNQEKLINNSKARGIANISDLINEKIQEKLIKLIEKNPSGIWCSELPRLYVEEFGFDLQYSLMGFNSIIEFVGALPHIFKIIVPPNTRKQMVIDANKDSNDLLTNTLISSTPSKSIENIQLESQPHPLTLSPKVAKSFIPENAMNCDETVDQISASSLFTSPNSTVDVVVCDVHNPSFFWIMLRQNKNKLRKLMSDLQNFYTQQDLNKYKVANAVLQSGLNIACTFADIWHRGIVTKIKSNGVEIQFYDYGTICTYNLEDIYYLDKKFTNLPAQAIPCSLYNVKPIESNKWLSECCKTFQKKVFEKDFVAPIFSINKENNSLTINLIDTSSSEEVYINEWMIRMNMAKWGKCNCKKNNFAFEHYNKCFKIADNTASNEFLRIEKLTNKISFVSIDLTISSSPTYVNSKKKLEALKKYQLNMSSSSSSSSESPLSGTEDSASSVSSASSISSITYSINEKQDKIDSGMSDEGEEKVDNPEFSSKDTFGSQLSLLSTDSFISNLSSGCSKLMFKSSVEPSLCNSSGSNSNGKHQKNRKSTQGTVNSTLKELQTLIANTKRKN